MTAAGPRGRISTSVSLAGLLLLATVTNAYAQSPDPQTVINSYRRQDWTGKGTYHRLGLFREQDNAVSQFYESGKAVTEGEEAAVQPAESPSLWETLRGFLSLDAHSNTMLFTSSNILNTNRRAISDSQIADFLGAGLDATYGSFKLSTGFDQSWFRFQDLAENDFNVTTVRQGLSYAKFLFDNAAGVTLTPSWQYSVLHSRETSDEILNPWTYGINNEIGWFPARWAIGTFSYDFGYQDAHSPSGAKDKYKHDFNAGLTLIPISDLKLYVSPSVQFSLEDYAGGGRPDEAWTPTLALTFQPLGFLAVDAVGSYTDSRSDVEGASFTTWTGTLFVRLFYRL